MDFWAQLSSSIWVVSKERLESSFENWDVLAKRTDSLCSSSSLSDIPLHVAISFSRRSSLPRDWTRVSHIIGRCFTLWATREAPFHVKDWKGEVQPVHNKTAGFSGRHTTGEGVTENGRGKHPRTRGCPQRWGRVTAALRAAHTVPACYGESATLKPNAICPSLLSPGRPAVTTEVQPLSFPPRSGFRDLKRVALHPLCWECLHHRNGWRLPESWLLNTGQHTIGLSPHHLLKWPLWKAKWLHCLQIHRTV